MRVRVTTVVMETQQCFPLCDIQLHVIVNNKVLIVLQQCLYVAGNKEVCLVLDVKYPTFCLFVNKFEFYIQIFTLSAHYQFSLKSASDSHADACLEPADRRTDGHDEANRGV